MRCQKISCDFFLSQKVNKFPANFDSDGFEIPANFVVYKHYKIIKANQNNNFIACMNKIQKLNFRAKINPFDSYF